MEGVVHVIGAGVAGLSAAVWLADVGRRVVLYEASGAAGGRCRSFDDPALGLTIDNGNHLFLSGNWAALNYLDRIGAGDALTRQSGRAAFPFADLATGERWTLRLSEGRLPWWVLSAARRVPGTRVRDYFASLGILRANINRTVGEAMTCAGPLYERLWRPLLLAALNTEPSEASAGLAARLLRETLVAGGQACHPLVARSGLSATFVDPALRHLTAKGAAVHFGRRLRAIAFGRNAAQGLNFGDLNLELGPEDALVLAVPPWTARDLLPEVETPTSFRAILNAHFRIAPPADMPPITGLVGGLSEWLFAFPDRLSVTISGADRLHGVSREALAQRIWQEVATVTRLTQALPCWQIVREKRATFAATPDNANRRSPARTRYRNLVLAGDWTATGLPATIEGAVRSGYTAAALVQGRAIQRSTSRSSRLIKTSPAR
jgi:squalene-associated FAD-dependent desaturase